MKHGQVPRRSNIANGPNCSEIERFMIQFKQGTARGSEESKLVQGYASFI